MMSSPMWADAALINGATTNDKVELVAQTIHQAVHVVCLWVGLERCSLALRKRSGFMTTHRWLEGSG
jgi:hypothetical protein